MMSLEIESLFYFKQIIVQFISPLIMEIPSEYFDESLLKTNDMG